MYNDYLPTCFSLDIKEERMKPVKSIELNYHSMSITSSFIKCMPFEVIVALLKLIVMKRQKMLNSYVQQKFDILEDYLSLHTV